MNKLTWFRLMWKNWFIQLFVVGLTILIASFFLPDLGLPGGIIGAAICIIIGYWGFYKFWKEYSKEIELKRIQSDIDEDLKKINKHLKERNRHQ